MRGGGGRLGRGMEEWRKEEGGEAGKRARSSEEMGERKRRERRGGNCKRREKLERVEGKWLLPDKRLKRNSFFSLDHHI